MHKNKMLQGGLLAATLMVSPLLLAAVDADQAARLGRDLTPMGAEKAGNAAGTIPAWDGGLSRDAGAYDPATGYKDPYAADQPLFTITKANLDQYREQLSTGQQAMFERYPATWKMEVFPSRRSASYSDEVYAAVKANATSAKLIEGGNSVEGAKFAAPFPIPQSGVEVVWNHLLRFRGEGVKRPQAQVVVQANGSYFLSRMEDTYLHNPNVTQPGKDNSNMLYYHRQVMKEPARMAGEVILILETVNQIAEPRQVWGYASGHRRVRRVPNSVYDSPGRASDGTRTIDGFDMFNGAPDRYNWEIVGKKEMYVPYNNYRFASNSNKYKDMIKPGHVDSSLPRYELHRVWHVRATLKDGMRHQYKQRDLYLDEDSYQILMADYRDNKDQLWRFSEAYTINLYDQPLVWTRGDATYDLLTGRYVVALMTNEEPATEFGLTLKPSEFTPAQLRASGRR